VSSTVRGFLLVSLALPGWQQVLEELGGGVRESATLSGPKAPVGGRGLGGQMSRLACSAGLPGGGM
jgi:hypothetical protein